jgi:type I restriction enzyme S subunit
MSIETFLYNKFLGNHPNNQRWREVIASVCIEFIESGLADKNFQSVLCSGSDKKFWSRVSEAWVASILRKKGLSIKPSNGGGPDFLVIDNGHKIWIEVTCPEAKGVPLKWTNLKLEEGKVSPGFDFPQKQILLRWTSAIKEKAEKLLGSLDGKEKGYIEKGIVSSEDSYVIAVNGCQLRNGPAPAFLGISGLPFAAEAVFQIGPYQVIFDSETLKQIGEEYKYQPQIFNQNHAPVPTDSFLHERFRLISAIWATDLDGASCIGNPEPIAVIHNHFAFNPIQVGLLPAHNEYKATPIDTDMFELNRIDGCFSFFDRLY